MENDDPLAAIMGGEATTEHEEVKSPETPDTSTATAAPTAPVEKPETATATATAQKEALRSMIDDMAEGKSPADIMALMKEMAAKIKDISTKANQWDGAAHAEEMRARCNAFDKQYPALAGKHDECYNHACQMADKAVIGKNGPAADAIWEYVANQEFAKKAEEMAKSGAAPAKNPPKPVVAGAVVVDTAKKPGKLSPEELFQQMAEDLNKLS